MTWQPCVAVSRRTVAYVLQTATSQHPRSQFSLLVMCCAKSTMAEISNCSSEERLLGRVLNTWNGSAGHTTNQVIPFQGWFWKPSPRTARDVAWISQRNVLRPVDLSWLCNIGFANIMVSTQSLLNQTREQPVGIKKGGWQCVTVTQTQNYEPPLLIPSPL
jgi:hypothetical protein